METVRIRLEELEQNTGQIPGLPGNPRQWTRAEVDRIAKSLRETPELFEARPIIVTHHAGKFVILGGNLRYEGCKRNKDKDAPCFILPDDTTIDKMKEIVIKDNGSFGSWDYDALANEWDVPFEDWGVPAWETDKVSPDEFGEDFKLPDGDKAPFRQISFQLSNEMAEVLLYAVEMGKYTDDFYGIEGDNEDKNANGVSAYIIARDWIERQSERFSDGDYETAKKEVEGLRLYLRDALRKSGRKASDVDALLGTNGMSGHYFGASQWMFPTQEAYEKMREIMDLPRDFFECKEVELRFRLIDTLKKKIDGWER